VLLKATWNFFGNLSHIVFLLTFLLKLLPGFCCKLFTCSYQFCETPFSVKRNAKGKNVLGDNMADSKKRSFTKKGRQSLPLLNLDVHLNGYHPFWVSRKHSTFYVFYFDSPLTMIHHGFGYVHPGFGCTKIYVIFVNFCVVCVIYLNYTR
jgi:hypothetical protein